MTRKKTHKKTQSSQGAAAASKLVPILAPRRASKDGCRLPLPLPRSAAYCALCAVCQVKADRRGPKGHPGLAGWGLGSQVCPGEPEACSLQG